jgi:hypothetical protein
MPADVCLGTTECDKPKFKITIRTRLLSRWRRMTRNMPKYKWMIMKTTSTKIMDITAITVLPARGMDQARRHQKIPLATLLVTTRNRRIREYMRLRKRTTHMTTAGQPSSQLAITIVGCRAVVSLAQLVGVSSCCRTIFGAALNVKRRVKWALKR